MRSLFLLLSLLIITVGYSQSELEQYQLIQRKKKIDSLIQLKDINSADSALESISDLLSNQEYNYFVSLIHKQHKNVIHVSWFSFTRFGQNRFTNRLPHIEYLRKIGDLTFGLRYTAAGTPEFKSSQIEGDIYFPISKHSYAYLSAGAAINGPFFPRYRGNAEYYLEYPKWGLVLGNRVLALENKTIDIATLQLHYTIQNWQIKYRNYTLFDQNEQFLNHLLIAQVFGPSNESHLQFELHYATSPVYIGFNQFLDFSNSIRFGIQAKQRIKKNFFLQPYLLLDQNISDNNTVQLTSQLIISYRF